MRALVLCFAMATVGLTAVPARADTVVLGDGDRIEGKVLEHGQRVRIEMDFGTVEIPRSQIVRIERKPGKLRAFERHLSRAETVDQLVSVARWAAAHDLPRRSRDVYRRILAMKPDHEEAHQALGHVRVEGRWVSEAEAKRAQGYRYVGGVWLSADELRARERRRWAAQVARAPAPQPDRPPQPARPEDPTEPAPDGPWFWTSPWIPWGGGWGPMAWWWWHRHIAHRRAWHRRVGAGPQPGAATPPGLRGPRPLPPPFFYGFGPGLRGSRSGYRRSSGAPPASRTAPVRRRSTPRIRSAPAVRPLPRMRRPMPAPRRGRRP